MALVITVGSVSVTINPLASANPVVTQPANAAAVYSAFAESIGGSDLALEVFNAISDVVNMNTPGASRVSWPDKYGSTTKPWGRPDDTGPTGTGYPEIRCEDAGSSTLWTDTINRQATGRKSFLDDKANLAVAIATGIKKAVEDNFQAGRITLTGTTTNVSVPFIGAGTEILIARRTDGTAFGSIRVTSVTPGSPGSFVITSSSPTDDGLVSWFAVGR